MRKPTIWVPTRSDTNWAVQSNKKARSLKFQIQEEEGLSYQCSKNKGVDQLCSYCTADLRLCFRLFCCFSFVAARCGSNPVCIEADLRSAPRPGTVSFMGINLVMTIFL